MVEFKIGNRYKFRTIAPVTLKPEYVNVKLIGTLTFGMAISFTDVTGLHLRVQEEVGRSIKGIENSSFYVFENDDKERVVLSSLWINLDTVESIQEMKLKIEVTINDLTDQYVIENMLKELGYTDVTTKLVTV